MDGKKFYAEFLLYCVTRYSVSVIFYAVIDDYNSERKEIRRKKGSKYRFSYGDYVVKSMVSVYLLFKI